MIFCCIFTNENYSRKFIVNIFPFKYKFQLQFGFFIVFIVIISQVGEFHGIQNDKLPLIYNIELVYNYPTPSHLPTINFKFHNHYNYKFEDVYLSFSTSNFDRIKQYNNFCKLKLKNQEILQANIVVIVRKQTWIPAFHTKRNPDEYLS